MDPTIVTYYRASEQGEAILAELDDRLSHESANGYVRISTPRRNDGMVGIEFASDVDKGDAHRRVQAVLSEIDPSWGEHLKVAEGTAPEA